MSERHDVIVVGLGAMGSAALYQLAKRGANVLGIDRYEPPHNMGSSHGETRITRQAPGEGAMYFPLVQRSFDIWVELEAHSGETLLHPTGGLIICPVQGGAQFHGNTNFVTATAAIAQAHRVKHEILAAHETMNRFPLLRLHDNEHTYYEPGSGLLRPERCIDVQIRLAQQHGATVHTYEPVLGYRTTSDGVSVKTEQGEYHADKLVLSAGAWMVDLLPQFREKMRVYRQGLYWFEVDDPAQIHVDRFPFVIWIGETMEDFFALFSAPSDGIPAMKVLTEQYLETTHPEEIDRTVKPDEIEMMYTTFLDGRVEGVRNNCLHAVACMYTVTPDEHFILDYHPESERVVVVSACSGHGFKHSAAVGEMLAQLALDGDTRADRTPFSLSRFG